MTLDIPFLERVPGVARVAISGGVSTAVNLPAWMIFAIWSSVENLPTTAKRPELLGSCFRNFDVNRTRALFAQLLQGQIGMSVRGALVGAPVTQLRKGGAEIPVIVQPYLEEPKDLKT